VRGVIDINPDLLPFPGLGLEKLYLSSILLVGVWLDFRRAGHNIHLLNPLVNTKGGGAINLERVVAK
jgi:hypothetical protein